MFVYGIPPLLFKENLIRYYSTDRRGNEIKGAKNMGDLKTGFSIAGVQR